MTSIHKIGQEQTWLFARQTPPLINTQVVLGGRHKPKYFLTTQYVIPYGRAAHVYVKVCIATSYTHQHIFTYLIFIFSQILLWFKLKTISFLTFGYFMVTSLFVASVWESRKNCGHAVSTQSSWRTIRGDCTCLSNKVWLNSRLITFRRRVLSLLW